MGLEDQQMMTRNRVILTTVLLVSLNTLVGKCESSPLYRKPIPDLDDTLRSELNKIDPVEVNIPSSEGITTANVAQPTATTQTAELKIAPSSVTGVIEEAKETSAIGKITTEQDENDSTETAPPMTAISTSEGKKLSEAFQQADTQQKTETSASSIKSSLTAAPSADMTTLIETTSSQSTKIKPINTFTPNPLLASAGTETNVASSAFPVRDEQSVTVADEELDTSGVSFKTDEDDSENARAPGSDSPVTMPETTKSLLITTVVPDNEASPPKVELGETKEPEIIAESVTTETSAVAGTITGKYISEDKLSSDLFTAATTDSVQTESSHQTLEDLTSAAKDTTTTLLMSEGSRSKSTEHTVITEQLTEFISDDAKLPVTTEAATTKFIGTTEPVSQPPPVSETSHVSLAVSTLTTDGGVTVEKLTAQREKPTNSASAHSTEAALTSTRSHHDTEVNGISESPMLDRTLLTKGTDSSNGISSIKGLRSTAAPITPTETSKQSTISSDNVLPNTASILSKDEEASTRSSQITISAASTLHSIVHTTGYTLTTTEEVPVIETTGFSTTADTVLLEETSAEHLQPTSSVKSPVISSPTIKPFKLETSTAQPTVPDYAESVAEKSETTHSIEQSLPPKAEPSEAKSEAHEGSQTLTTESTVKSVAGTEQSTIITTQPEQPSFHAETVTLTTPTALASPNPTSLAAVKTTTTMDKEPEETTTLFKSEPQSTTEIIIKPHPRTTTKETQKETTLLITEPQSTTEVIITPHPGTTTEETQKETTLRISEPQSTTGIIITSHPGTTTEETQKETTLHISEPQSTTEVIIAPHPGTTTEETQKETTLHISEPQSTTEVIITPHPGTTTEETQKETTLHIPKPQSTTEVITTPHPGTTTKETQKEKTLLITEPQSTPEVIITPHPETTTEETQKETTLLITEPQSTPEVIITPHPGTTTEETQKETTLHISEPQAITVAGTSEVIPSHVQSTFPSAPSQSHSRIYVVTTSKSTDETQGVSSTPKSSVEDHTTVHLPITTLLSGSAGKITSQTSSLRMTDEPSTHSSAVASEIYSPSKSDSTSIPPTVHETTVSATASTILPSTSERLMPVPGTSSVGLVRTTGQGSEVTSLGHVSTSASSTQTTASTELKIPSTVFTLGSTHAVSTAPVQQTSQETTIMQPTIKELQTSTTSSVTDTSSLPTQPAETKSSPFESTIATVHTAEIQSASLTPTSTPLPHPTVQTDTSEVRVTELVTVSPLTALSTVPTVITAFPSTHVQTAEYSSSTAETLTSLVDRKPMVTTTELQSVTTTTQTSAHSTSTVRSFKTARTEEKNREPTFTVSSTWHQTDVPLTPPINERKGEEPESINEPWKKFEKLDRRDKDLPSVLPVIKPSKQSYTEKPRLGPEEEVSPATFSRGLTIALVLLAMLVVLLSIGLILFLVWMRHHRRQSTHSTTFTRIEDTRGSVNSDERPRISGQSAVQLPARRPHRRHRPGLRRQCEYIVETPEVAVSSREAVRRRQQRRRARLLADNTLMGYVPQDSPFGLHHPRNQRDNSDSVVLVGAWCKRTSADSHALISPVVTQSRTDTSDGYVTADTYIEPPVPYVDDDRVNTNGSDEYGKRINTSDSSRASKATSERSLSASNSQGWKHIDES
ncbi:unnamed protein product [Calicophoron daubneyi]|uniref:Uncharacterized protein n=1 Tax=Calicophoron daubneyi TaxID=300641 RepID=A0AAV2TNH5_CALDB